MAKHHREQREQPKKRVRGDPEESTRIRRNESNRSKKHKIRISMRVERRAGKHRPDYTQQDEE